MSSILSSLFFICLIPSTLFSYFFFPSLCEHGRDSTANISKNYFVVFYLAGISYFVLNRQYSFYLILLCRRTVECLIFRYRRSRMNVLQFFLGVIYYLIMSHHLSAYTHFYEPNMGNYHQNNSNIFENLHSPHTPFESISESHTSLTVKIYTFFLKNVLQLGRNNFNFKRIFLSKSFIFFNILQSVSHYLVFVRRYQNIHYLVEFLIYLHLFLKLRSFILGLNIIWILIFVFITIRMRYLERINTYKDK